MKRKAKTFFLYLLIIMAFMLLLTLWQEHSEQGTGRSGMGISLARPAFAQEDGGSFLEQEAGIAAYTDVGRSIDLVKAKSVLRTVERETNEYIIGSIPLPGYLETEDIHAYIHRDGLIATYYISYEPAAKIVDWNHYKKDEKIDGTKLEIGMLVVSSAAGVPMKDVSYYDFGNPDANKLMVVAKAQRQTSRGRKVEFRLKLPGEFLFYERSFSHTGTSTLYINGAEISHIKKYDTTNYGLLSPMQLSPDEYHTVLIEQYGTDIAFAAIALIYREP